MQSVRAAALHPADATRTAMRSANRTSAAVLEGPGGIAKRSRRISDGSVLQPDELCSRCCADQAEVVGCDDDGRALAIERREEMQQTLCHRGVDIAGRLIRHEQVGPV